MTNKLGRQHSCPNPAGFIVNILLYPLKQNKQEMTYIFPQFYLYSAVPGRTKMIIESFFFVCVYCNPFVRFLLWMNDFFYCIFLGRYLFFYSHLQTPRGCHLTYHPLNILTHTASAHFGVFISSHLSFISAKELKTGTSSPRKFEAN